MYKIIKIWNNDPESKKLGLLSLATIVGIAAAYMLLLQPIRTQQQAVLQNKSELQAQIQNLRSYDISEAEFYDISSKLEAKRADLLAVLPTNTDSFTTVAVITEMAKNNNLSMRSFKVADNADKDGYKIQRFDCIVSGGYFELVAFLEQLQQRSAMTNVQISSINAETDSKLLATMQIYTYAME